MKTNWATTEPTLIRHCVAQQKTSSRMRSVKIRSNVSRRIEALAGGDQEVMDLIEASGEQVVQEVDIKKDECQD
jgi:hypothetical protein